MGNTSAVSLHRKVNLADHLQWLLLPPSITENMWKIPGDGMEMQINSFVVLRGDPLLWEDKHQAGEWLRDGDRDRHIARTADFPGNLLYLKLEREDSNLKPSNLLPQMKKSSI